MKIYAPMIAYGGTCRAEYAFSFISLVSYLQKQSEIELTSTGIFFESLISRARNACAAKVFNDKSITHLLFVDADIAFTPEDFMRLVEADKDLVAGAYCKKYFQEEKMKYIARNKPSMFLDKSWRSFATDFTSEIKEENLSKIRSGEKMVEIDHAATGFMLIKREVFEKIAKEKPEIEYENNVDGYSAISDRFFDFFPSGVDKKTGHFLSEDYGLTRLWQSVGGKVHLITDLNLVHYGSVGYEGNLYNQINFYK